MTTTTAPTTIWLTDRSRFKAGTQRCARQRYLSYHFGSTGYGITAKRESLPLVTGISVHQGLEAFAHILATDDRLPDQGEVRAIVAALQQDYVRRVEARGYRGILGSDETEVTIAEQTTLVSGLLWAARLKLLPWLHERYQIVAAEKERLHFLHCSCGAPPLDQAEHIRRGCTGQALMIRTDLLAKRRGGQSLAYFEFKTTGWESEAWTEKWEIDPQLALGTLDAEQLWGAEVTELYIVGLNKGRRQRDRYEEDQRKKQLSPLCYGFCKPANPPLAHDDWLPSYEWVDESGTTKRKSKLHRRRGVWELEGSDWPTYRAYKGQDPDLTPAEFWARFLPQSLLDRICFVLGPMNRQDQQLRSVLLNMKGEEDRWQEVLWTLYELKHPWASEAFQRDLDLLVPCSWACRPFGREHQCEFVPICHRHGGWEDPIGTGLYKPRLPHHDPERLQAVARGLLPENAEEVEEED